MESESWDEDFLSGEELFSYDSEEEDDLLPQGKPTLNHQDGKPFFEWVKSYEHCVNNSHHQCCDAIDYFSNNILFYSSGYSVFRLNVSTGEVKEEFRIRSPIYSVVCKEGYLVVCGLSFLYVKDLKEEKVVYNSSEDTMDLDIFGMVNGADIGPIGQKDKKLFIAKNEGQFFVYDLPSMHLVYESDHRAAMNYIRLSPDAKWLAIPADERAVYIYSVTNNATSFRFHKKLESQTSSYYSHPQYCSWSADSKLLAATSENRHLYIWEASSNFTLKYSITEERSLYGVKFFHHENILCAVTRSKLNILHPSSEKFQVISTGTEIIHGVAVNSEGDMFIATSKHIHQFKIAKTPSLTNLCIDFIHKNKKLYWNSEDINKQIPGHLIEMIEAKKNESVLNVEILSKLSDL